MSKIEFIALLLLTLGSNVFSQPVAPLPLKTTTTLIAAPNTNPVTAGTTVTLTATVQLNGSPLAKGAVLFCEASVSRCSDLALLGSAQLTRSGTATIKLTPGVGNYSIRAVFRGTPRTAPATSMSVSTPVRIRVVANTAPRNTKAAAVRATGTK